MNVVVETSKYGKIAEDMDQDELLMHDKMLLLKSNSLTPEEKSALVPIPK